jgi:hypothetical protein
MSTDAYEKSNKLNDTIPNIINQILYLSTEVWRIVIKKNTDWPSEISNEDLARLIDTSNEKMMMLQ